MEAKAASLSKSLNVNFPKYIDIFTHIQISSDKMCVGDDIDYITQSAHFLWICYLLIPKWWPFKVEATLHLLPDPSLPDRPHMSLTAALLPDTAHTAAPPLLFRNISFLSKWSFLAKICCCCQMCYFPKLSIFFKMCVVCKMFGLGHNVRFFQNGFCQNVCFW